jgi:RNA ligase
MIEYPSIINSSKAPRKQCIAFDKLDGSNFRAKYTQKRGFETYGTRTQLIDETTPFWCEMVQIFKRDLKQPLEDLFKKHKEYRDFREICVFGEFYGENSIAGFHEQEPHKITIFDVLLGHKQRRFLKPKELIKNIGTVIEIPKVVYEGNLNESFIKDVRDGVYDVKEGVICKGEETSGAFAGNMWQCKIKTQKYLDYLKVRFKDEWEKYAE